MRELQPFLILFLLSNLLPLNLWAGAKAPKNPDENNKGWHLSEVLKDSSITGISLDSPESLSFTEAQVDQLAEAQTGKATPQRMKEILANCDGYKTDLIQKPLCPYLINLLQPAKKTSANREFSRKVRETVLDFKKGRVENLIKTESNVLNAALRKIRGISTVENLAQKLLMQKECPSSALLLALGIKSEEEFPNPKYRGLTTSLYRRVSECSQDFSSVQASYRLGLFHVWDGKCEEAEKVLSKIPDTPQAPDYRIRIAYWRFFCAQQTDNKVLQNKLQSWLQKEYPLSFHSLLTFRKEDPDSNVRFSRSFDPEISFRSTVDPQIAPIVRTVEILLLKNMPRAASDVLVRYLDRVQLTEIPFQLYWVILMRRAGDNPAAFQFLAGLFRARPDLISRETLQVMYPVQHLDAITGLDLAIDPYLVLSLMRQESAFDPAARSRAGARGLMQLQPATARLYERISLKQLHQPKANVRIGTKYLESLIRKFGGKLDLALAAYNAGPSKVSYWTKRYQMENRLLYLDLLPVRETRDYVTSIARNYFWYFKLYPPAEIGCQPPGEGALLFKVLSSRAPSSAISQ